MFESKDEEEPIDSGVEENMSAIFNTNKKEVKKIKIGLEDEWF